MASSWVTLFTRLSSATSLLGVHTAVQWKPGVIWQNQHSHTDMTTQQQNSRTNQSYALCGKLWPLQEVISSKWQKDLQSTFSKDEANLMKALIRHFSKWPRSLWIQSTRKPEKCQKDLQSTFSKDKANLMKAFIGHFSIKKTSLWIQSTLNQGTSSEHKVNLMKALTRHFWKGPHCEFKAP